MVEEILQFKLAFATDNKVENLRWVFGRSGIGHLQAGRSTQSDILREEILFTESVDKQIVLFVDKLADALARGNTPEVEVGLRATNIGSLMSDNESNFLVLGKQSHDANLLSLTLHHLGKMVKDVPMLLTVQTADDTDGLHLFDVIDFLLARSIFHLAEHLLASEIFNYIQHISIK